jgi:hypothetical protein
MGWQVPYRGVIRSNDRVDQVRLLRNPAQEVVLSLAPVRSKSRLICSKLSPC